VTDPAHVGSAERVGRGLDLRQVALPPLGIADRVVVAPALPVDRLPDDLGVTRVLRGLGQHPGQQVTERRVLPLRRPPVHERRRVQRHLGDHRVGVAPDLPVEPDDPVAGLLGGGPHVAALPGRTVLVPRDRHRHRPPDALTQVSGLDTGQVLDQTEQVGAGRHDRAARVVVAHPVEGTQHRVPGLLQVVPQVVVDHGRTVAPASDRSARTGDTRGEPMLVRRQACSAC